MLRFRCPVLPGLLALLVGLTSVSAPNGASAGEPGSAGVLSLRFGVGARSGAMGETGVATAYDGSAIYWNPANLAYSKGTQITAQHMEYFGTFRKESFGLGHQTDVGSFGLLFSGFYSDELQRTSLESQGVPQGTFQPYDLVFGLGYALAFSEFALGITGKVIYERIDLYDGVATAVDIGISHQAKIEGLTLAAVLQNYGSSFKLNEEEIDLPVTLRLAAAYRPTFGPLWNGERLTLTSEVVVPNDGNSRLHAGAELWLHESFAVRGGHRFSYETYRETLGAGFRRGNLAVDYAFMNNDNDFDATHRFSVSVAYGADDADDTN